MINWKENKSFCPYPFKAALLEHSNDKVVPCCRWAAFSHDDHFTNHLATDSKSQVMDYKTYFDEIREKMIKGESIQECKKCYQQENDGVRSMRTIALADFVKNSKELQARQKNRGPKGLIQEITQPKLEYLEIESGRYCNLKCRSCGPNLSSSWDEDVKNNDKVLTNFFGSNHEVFDDIQSRTNTNDSLALLTYEDCKHLTEIKVTGGEPFLTDSFLRFIENLVEWDIAKNILLDVFTNASFYPKEKHITMLTKFRLVDINLSIDGVGERNNFLRKKSKWQVVEKVAKKWEELSLENENITIGISHTYTIFNSLYYDEFLNWCYTYFDKRTISGTKDTDSDFIDFTVSYGPDYLSVRNFSSEVREKILQQVKNQWNHIKGFKEYNITTDRLFAKGIIDHSFKQLIGALTSSDANGNAVDSIFKEKTEMFDRIRKENWRETFPKLAEVIDE
tara:strand:- start:86 stop:1435 length:1350 start_codon:yes stop_codon:yes gene_type:complete